MLNVYAWSICPHCHAAVDWLKAHGVPFAYHEIEEQPPELLQKVIDVNGGDDWVVPTLEFNGKWRAGKAFDARTFPDDLRALGMDIKS